jgi:hypothetical protein
MTVELEIEKRIVGSSTGQQEVNDWTLWRGRPPPEQKKKRPKYNPRKRTKMILVHLNRLAPNQGTARVERS